MKEFLDLKNFPPTFICRADHLCVDLSSMSIDFYDENDVVEVPKGDQDVEVLAQGLLRLSPLVQKPQRAATHCADLLTVARFVEAYKLELKLGKGDLTTLQVGSRWSCYLAVVCVIVRFLRFS